MKFEVKRIVALDKVDVVIDEVEKSSTKPWILLVIPPRSRTMGEKFYITDNRVLRHCRAVWHKNEIILIAGRNEGHMHKGWERAAEEAMSEWVERTYSRTETIGSTSTLEWYRRRQ